MFKGIDYYDIESELSQEARLVRDTARAFVEREFLPVIREHYRAGTFPLDLAPRMGALGMFGANLSGYGLPAIDNISYGLLMQELERGDSGLRSFASVQGALVMYPILAFGSEAQRIFSSQAARGAGNDDHAAVADSHVHPRWVDAAAAAAYFVRSCSRSWCL